MLLWSPEENSDVDELEKETNIIQSAVDSFNKTDFKECIADIGSLRTLTARTVFADSVATTLESTLPADQVRDDRLSRLAAITRAVKGFRDLVKSVDDIDRSF
jgi:hypothetical protein